MNKAVCIFLAVILVSAVLVFAPRRVTVTDFAMNTVISIEVKAPKAKRIAEAAVSEVKRIDSLMSATLPQSDIYRINHSPSGTYVKVSPEVYSLIETCLDISRKTDGYFDITTGALCDLWNINSQNPSVPKEEDIKKALELTGYGKITLRKEDCSVRLEKEGMSITLGAIAKGYAADRVSALLRKSGVKEAIIDLGGNIYILGREKTVGIQTPFAPKGEYFRTETVSDMAVVTSGAYERYFEEDGRIYHHIIDPFTGYPAEGAAKSATVISDSSTLADALSTAVFIMGETALGEFDNCRAVLCE